MVVAPQKPKTATVYYGTDIEEIYSVESIYKLLNATRRSISHTLVLALGGGSSGCFKAIVVHNFWYWMSKGSGVIYQGKRWVYNTIGTIAEQIGASYDETRRVLEALRWEDKVLIAKPLGKELDIHWRSYQTLYYTLDFTRLREKFKERGLLEQESKDQEDFNENIINDEEKSHEDIVTNNDLSNNSINTQLADLPDNLAGQPGYLASVARHNKNKSSKNYSQPNPPTLKRESEKEKNNSQEQVESQNCTCPPNLEQLSQTNNPVTGQQSKAFDKDNSTAKRERFSLSQSALKPDNQIVNKVSVQPVKAKAPWKTDSELQQFRAALVQALPIVANAKSPEALANKIISQLRQGESHSYWDDFKAENPIGWSLKPEWEIMPGEPYPMFVQYLMNKLSEPHDSREKRLEKAWATLEKPRRAKGFWEEFKRAVGLSADSVERDRQLGVSHPNVPNWATQVEQIPFEEAVEAAKIIQEVAGGDRAVQQARANLSKKLKPSSTEDNSSKQIEQANPVQQEAEGVEEEANSSVQVAQKVQTAPPTNEVNQISDPWADDEPIDTDAAASSKAQPEAELADPQRPQPSCEPSSNDAAVTKATVNNASEEVNSNSATFKASPESDKSQVAPSEQPKSEPPPNWERTKNGLGAMFKKMPGAEGSEMKPESESEYQKLKAWVKDPILRKEAMPRIMNSEIYDPIFDEYGNIIDIERRHGNTS